MADEKNTADKTIVDPTNPEAQIDNPDYVKPAEAKPAEAAKDDLNLTPASVKVTVGKTGNDTIDAVGALLAERNIENADAIIANYAETGKVSLTDKATLVEELGEATAKMVINQLTDEATKIKSEGNAARNETLDYANKLFNGKDADQTWKEIQAFVKDPESGFSEADKTALRKMIRAGGMQARLAFDNIASAYHANSNTTSQADLLQGDTYVQGSFEPISSKAYAKEVKTLTAEYGYESLQVQQLKARRTQSRSNGVA